MTTKVSSGNFSNDITNYLTNVVAGGPRISTVAVTNSAYIVTGANILSQNTGGYVKITGSNFFSNTQVLIRRGALVLATSIIYTSNSELRVQLPASNVGYNVLYVVNYDSKFSANLISYQ
jgi:hypothetical protein